MHGIVVGDGGGDVGEVVAVAQGEMGTAARHRRCFSPSLPVPSSSSLELLLPSPVSSSSASLLRCRYVSSPGPVDHHLLRLSCFGVGCHSSPPPPPHVSSSHLQERRESTPISTHIRMAPSFRHPHGVIATVPSGAQIAHAHCDTARARDGLSLALMRGSSR
jgi:hypothetical protein